MNEKEFLKIKQEKPDSRIGQRSFDYQKARDELARALKDERNGDNFWDKFLKSLKLKKNISVEEAKKNYYLQKAFSRECRIKDGDDFKLVLNKDFKEYIGKLSTKNLQSFADSITHGLEKYANHIIYVSEQQEDAPTDDEIAPFVVGNKLLKYIADNRNDVKATTVEINEPHTHVKAA